MLSFDKQVKDLEREIRDLKASQRLAPMIKCYYKVIESQDVGAHTITYGSGSQPIITEILFTSTVCQGVPDESTNTQTVYFSGQTVGGCMIMSTRPIISIS